MVFFSKKEPEKITFRAIVELLGKPKEHLEETMETVMQNLKNNDMYEVKKLKIEPAEQKENFYIIFSDIEVSSKNFGDMLSFCFEYLPSSIEIIEPHEFNLNLVRLNGWLNDFVGRLHESDQVAKTTKAENEILHLNTIQIYRNFLRLILHDGEKTLVQISKLTGIPNEHIERFVLPYVKEGWVEKTENGFALAR